MTMRRLDVKLRINEDRIWEATDENYVIFRKKLRLFTKSLREKVTKIRMNMVPARRFDCALSESWLLSIMM